MGLGIRYLTPIVLVFDLVLVKERDLNKDEDLLLVLAKISLVPSVGHMIPTLWPRSRVPRWGLSTRGAHAI
jgi:hypothetical protein